MAGPRELSVFVGLMSFVNSVSPQDMKRFGPIGGNEVSYTGFSTSAGLAMEALLCMTGGAKLELPTPSRSHRHENKRGIEARNRTSYSPHHV